MKSERVFFESLGSIEYLQNDAQVMYYDFFIKMAKERGIPITTELEFAAWGQAFLDLKYTTR